MSELKKAFSKLDKEKISGDAKQEIFDRLTAEYHRVRKTRRVLSAVVPSFAAALLIAAAAFIMPGMLTPQKSADEMVVIPRPEDNIAEDAVRALGEPQVVSTVVLSLNPVVELGLGADGSVVTAVGLDEDGEKLLAGIDCEGLSLENAAIVVINQLLLNDYISSEVEEAEITVSIDSEQMGIDSLNVVTQTIQTAAEKHDIEVSVTPSGSEQTKQLSIMLTGESKAEAQQTGENGTVTVEFIISEDDPSKVQNVSAYTKENDRLITSVDFSDMPFKEAVLYGLNDLIQQGYINDEGCEVFLKLSRQDDAKVSTLRYLAGLLADQAGLDLAAVPTEETGVLKLVATEPQQHEETAVSMSKILDPTVHKTKGDLTKTQAEILEFVYTEEQIEELLAIRYWVVVPNLVGMSEEKAVQVLSQMGLVPVVTSEYNEQYSDFEEGTVYYQDFSAGALVEKGDRFQLLVLGNEFGPLGQGWTQSVFSYSDISGGAGIKTEYEAYNSGSKTLYVEITNNSEVDVLEYDTDFTLERLYDGQWYSAVCTDCFEPSTKTLLPLGTVGEKIDISFAGELEEGQYRIIKQLGPFKYAAEFRIKQGGYSGDMLSGYAALEDLPVEYTLEAAKENGDLVIDGAGNVYNEDRLILFLDKVDKKLPCKVRRTTFTIEGNAIIYDFEYSGKYFAVTADATRDGSGEQGAEKTVYSYLSLGFSGDSISLMLVNSYDRMPLSGEYKNTNCCVILQDTQLVTSADVAEIVLQMIDEDAPLKVFSPDGRKYVSYAEGKKAVNYEVYGAEKQYAGGIILPEDRGEAAEMISLEWRDENVVLITYRTVDGEYVRLAFDVAAEEYTQLSEEEAAGLGTVEQDYFTDADMSGMLGQFVNEADEFIFTITMNGAETAYSADRLEAKLDISAENTQAIVPGWTEQQWTAFLSDVMDAGVFEWHSLYEAETAASIGEGVQNSGEGSGTDAVEWSLVIKGKNQAVISYGSGAVPEQFAQFLSVLEAYFGAENCGGIHGLDFGNNR